MTKVLCEAGLHDLDATGARRSIKVYKGNKRTSTVCNECYLAKVRRNGAVWRARRWSKIVEMYGGKCVCPGCGEDRPIMLSIDHVRDDGALHRRSLGGKTATTPVRTDAARQYQPEKYQLLCHNCNMTKGRHSCLDREGAVSS